MPDCAQCGRELPLDARFCPACGGPVEPGRPAQVEERKLATVLFADLVGSTALGASQDPERTRATLDRFYDAMAAEIEGAGGTVEKFAGDAVMAVFGAPAAQEDHAERALHAALSMRRRLEELFSDALHLRIGVNTGDVVVGRPREGSSFVTGDAVNVAARLEQAATPGEILAGERTVAAARGAFEFGPAETVQAKGKEGGVACRRLVRGLTLMRPRGVTGLRRAFVGRESELELLEATYRRAVEGGEPHLVTIMGDAGVGKTRLVRELWEWLAAQEPQPLQRTGRCLPYGQLAYWALGEVLKEHLGILESDPPETVSRRLGRREILGLALGLDVAGELHPLAARDRLHEAWIEFLGELAALRPAVILLEDLHWAEEPLLDLVERILRDVRGPLLLLATSRPELLDRRPAWGGGRRNASSLWLEALSAEESTRLLDELLATELPPRLREAVVGGAEGNPFFVEELLATLIDQGVLARENGAWRVQELPPGFTVPDSVQALLAARIDLLGHDEKAGLQAASVIGRVFWRGPVCELLDGVEPDCDVLEDRDFVRRRSGSTMAGEVEYAFKHQLTREVAYASLPKRRRTRLHARFADWLERVGEGRDEHAAFLAHHYAEAARPDDADLAWAGEEDELARLRTKAVHWLRRAAELAAGRYDIDEAIALLHRAIALEEEDVRLSLLWREIGRANALKYDGPAFWDAMQRSLAVCHNRATCADTYAELAFQTAIRAGMWMQAPDRSLVDGWIDSTLELAEAKTPARAKALLARMYWSDDSPPEVLEEADALVEQLGDPELRVIAWQARSLANFRDARMDDALAWAQRPFELVSQLTDPEITAEVYWAPIPPALVLGRLREARRLAAANDAASERLTPHHRVHGVSALAEVEELAGGWEALAALEERIVQSIAENDATPCIRNQRTLLLAALARAHLGDAAGAAQLEAEAEELAMQGYDYTLAGPRIALALVRGDHAAAERLLDAEPGIGGRRTLTWFGISRQTGRLDALAALGARGRVEAEATALAQPHTYLAPFALRALGLVREDEELVAQAISRFEAMGLAWHAAQTRRLVQQA